MKWFGSDWGAPVCERSEHVETPQEPCILCARPFDEHAQGLLLPFVGEPGDPSTLPFHLACFARALGLGEPRSSTSTSPLN